MVGDRRRITGRCGEADGRRGDRDRNRGQIILIGAIALAFIILGLVVLFNGAAYTETLAPDSAGQSGSDATVVEYELEQGIGGIAHRGNLEWESDYDQTLEEEIDTDFSSLYLGITANTRTAISDIEFVTIDEEALVRTDRSVSGLSTGPVERNVGHLAFELQSGSGGSLNITDSRQNKQITITDTGSGFEIEDGDNNDCTVRNDNANINVVTGEINATTDDNCEFNTIAVSERSTLTIEEEGSMAGTYDLVVKERSAVGSGIGYDYSDRAWTVDIHVTYESDEVAYERTQTVSVYGDSP